MKMRSVTEQAALDEFLSTAELAGTDFTAEKLNNVKVIHPDQRNPYLLSAGEERSAISKHDANRKRLTVPRRPPWNESMTKEELEFKEKGSFLEWRRDLAELQESNDLLMTPFERNIEVWRQLWRVLERSDLVVQIVDARNPFLFRSEDLEKYVKEVDPRKNNLLLVNKADMMTLEQRRAWADYFDKHQISYKFFSAYLAKEKSSAEVIEDEVAVDQTHTPRNEHRVTDRPNTDGDYTRACSHEKVEESTTENYREASEDDYDSGSEDSPTRILSVDELEKLFLEYAPEANGESCRLWGTIGILIRGSNRARLAPKDSSRPCGLSQCRKVFYYQCLDWGEESLGLCYARKDETFSDYSSKSFHHPVRLSRLSIPQLCNDQGGISV